MSDYFKSLHKTISERDRVNQFLLDKNYILYTYRLEYLTVLEEKFGIVIYELMKSDFSLRDYMTTKYSNQSYRLEECEYFIPKEIDAKIKKLLQSPLNMGWKQHYYNDLDKYEFEAVFPMTENELINRTNEFLLQQL